jgi:hypothetical protein
MTRSKKPTSHEEAIADLVERKLTSPDELVRDIDKIGRAFQSLSSTRLKWSTIVTLISDDSKVGKRDVERVLAAAVGLGQNHLKPEKKEKP